MIRESGRKFNFGSLYVRKEETVTVGKANPLLPEGTALEPFSPVAYYDSYMDCIRVLILDRSVTEVRVDDHLTLCRANHRTPFDPEHVGFTIKGVRHLFADLGLPLDGVLTLTQIIDAIVKRRPGSTVSKILAEFPEQNLTVEWNEARKAA
jgi:hypothetical protein